MNAPDTALLAALNDWYAATVGCRPSDDDPSITLPVLASLVAEYINERDAEPV